MAGTAITSFEFDGEPVRVVDIDGEPHLVAKDVAERLGYSDPTTAIRSHCRGVQKLHPLQTTGGVQKVRVIAEPDVLRLIMKSDLPEAERFERLVFEDVLPTIRRTGSYGVSIGARALAPTKAVSATELRRSHSYWLSIAERAGMDPNAALFSANRMTRKATGVDVLAEMGQPLLPSPTDEVVLPPTALCSVLGVTKAEINPLITKHGYQTAHRDHKNRPYYVLTPKGKEAGGRGLDRTIEHDKGTTMKVELKWPLSLADRLRADILAAAR